MVEDYLDMFEAMVRGGKTREEAYETIHRHFGKEVAKAVLREHERRAGLIRLLEDPLVIHKRGSRAWYTGPQEGDRCWPALKKYLAENKGWAVETLQSIDESSSKILSHMRPAGFGRIDTRGLVVGYVQSGKTANYTALIAKAADVGYRLFIVLAGVHNALRQQTQRRLGRELVALNGKLWVQLTSEIEDFRASAGGNTDVFLSDTAHLRILCVVKKNAHVLRRLKSWLNAGNRSVLDACPVLIIDDEADQAGLNSAAKPNERTAINRLILEIMGQLPKAAYVGYTATPFANVLVDPTAADLYPKDFIVELPRPDGYFGAERLFGRESLPKDEDDVEQRSALDMIRSVPEEDVPQVRPQSGKDRLSFAPEVPPSLDQALRYFAMACAARRTRGDRDDESMLVHTTLYTVPHERLRDAVEAAWKRYGAALAKNDEEFLSELEALWEEETERVPAEDFGLSRTRLRDLLVHLPAVFRDATVLAENGSSLERLVYDESPRTQIAVGGNTLSRGLTLEGLTVSYFVRSASAYDTLLQMGRWFGYRFGYEDLPRVWMTDGLAEWFRDLATVEAEIRRDIRRYEQEDMTPQEFAVRIRTHPSLAVTAAAKMRSAVECDISYADGTRQATIFEHRNVELLRANLEAAERLVSQLGSPEKRSDGRYAWYQVPAAKVLEFISSYRFHDRQPDLDPKALCGYIHDQNELGALESWDVLLASVKQPKVGTLPIGGVMVNLLDRSQLAPRPGQTYATVGTLTTQRDLLVGLPQGQEKRHREDRGLLMIYPISKDSRPSEKKLGKRVELNAVENIIGVAFDFPPSAKPTPQKYVRVNLRVPDQLDEEEELEDDETDEV